MTAVPVPCHLITSKLAKQNSQKSFTKFSILSNKILNFRSSESHHARMFGRVVTKINAVNFNFVFSKKRPIIIFSLRLSLSIITYSLLYFSDCDKTRFSRFFFLEALISERYVMVLAGNWWKLAYDQIHDDSRTKAQSAKASKKGFLGFCFFRC